MTTSDDYDAIYCFLFRIYTEKLVSLINFLEFKWQPIGFQKRETVGFFIAQNPVHTHSALCGRGALSVSRTKRKVAGWCGICIVPCATWE